MRRFAARGMRPPLFFRLAERKVAAAAVEKKGALVSKSRLWRVWTSAGVGRVGAEETWGDAECAWTLGDRDGAVPQLGTGVGLSGAVDAWASVSSR